VQVPDQRIQAFSAFSKRNVDGIEVFSATARTQPEYKPPSRNLLQCDSGLGYEEWWPQHAQ
jgi:hypothetical protein